MTGWNGLFSSSAPPGHPDTEAAGQATRAFGLPAAPSKEGGLVGTFKKVRQGKDLNLRGG